MPEDYRAVYHTPDPNDGVGHTHNEEGSVDVYIDAPGGGGLTITGQPDLSPPANDPLIANISVHEAAIAFADEPTNDGGLAVYPNPYPADTPALRAESAANGLPVDYVGPEIDAETPVIPPLTEIPTDCTDIFAEATNYNFPTNFFLSTNFTVGSLTVGCALSHYPLQPQNGLTTNQIVCNMRHLCINVLEPLKSQYANMFLTSGFRHGSGTSQHNKGQAADVQLSGTSYFQQWEAAKVLTQSLTYDQFILELGNNYWFHVSYNNGSNRQNVLTRVRPGVYKPNLIRVA